MQYASYLILLTLATNLYADNGGWWRFNAWPDHSSTHYDTMDVPAAEYCKYIGMTLDHLEPAFYGVVGSYDYKRQHVFCLRSDGLIHQTTILSDVYYQCPDDFFLINENPPSCEAYYLASRETQKKPGACEGDPCDPSSGKVFLSETDVTSSSHGLTFTRHYQSTGNGEQDSSFGINWRHSFSRNMNDTPSISIDNQSLLQSMRDATPEGACIQRWPGLRSKAYSGLLKDHYKVKYSNGLCHITDINDDNKILATIPVYSANEHGWPSGKKTANPLYTVSRPDGQVYLFKESGGSFTSLDTGGSKLETVGGELHFTDSTDTVERYGADQRLISTTDRSGRVTTYNYLQDGNLASVTDSFGNELTFTHDNNGRISSVTSSDGVVSYSYDAIGNLIQVIYPDQSTQQYRYENVLFPHHLTSLIDENSNQYATWSYDEKGRVISNEQAGGTAHYDFVYNSNSTTTVTDANGASRIYEFQFVKDSVQIKKITGDKCEACPGGSIQEKTYDPNGYLSSSTDWNGNITTYVHDSTGRELRRTEALGTPQQRIITTDWHTTFRLPVIITEPGKITEFTYDNQGRLLSKQQRTVQ